MATIDESDAPALVAETKPESRPSMNEPKPLNLGEALRQALTPIASLRLTVWLFVLAMLLVFFGTLAYDEEGLWRVLTNYFRTFVAWIPFQIFVKFGQVFLGLPANTQFQGHFPFPGGWIIGGLLLVNLLAAHAVRFKMNWKRSGILLIHSGLIVMMVSELITGVFALEGHMRIEEGGSANYATHENYYELAIIDRSGPKTDAVAVIPSWMLRKGGLIQDSGLPFDVFVDKWLVNAKLVSVQEAEQGRANPATAGVVGQQYFADPLPEGAKRTHGEEEITTDFPAAYVTFRKKSNGQSLGTYLVSTFLTSEQPVVVDGKSYDVAYRMMRSYKQFSLQLLEFKFDRHEGTTKPKNFSSKVRLIDPVRGEDREVIIRMNEPLRYEGDTFYQASWDLETEKATSLQVVRNPGWQMPYVSCGLVAVGMLVHFGLHLGEFLRRRAVS